MIVKKHLCINICVYTHIHPHVYIFKNSLEVELLDQRFLFQIVSSLANFLQKRLYHLPLTVPVTLHSFQVLLLLTFLKFAYQMSENILLFSKHLYFLIRLIIFIHLFICISFSVDCLLASLGSFLMIWLFCCLFIDALYMLWLLIYYLLNVLYKLDFSKLGFVKHYKDYQ